MPCYVPILLTAPLMSCGTSRGGIVKATDACIPKSLLCGIIHNARGGHSSEDISDLTALRLAVRSDVPPSGVFEDFQTVSSVPKADGSEAKRLIVYKQYLEDAAFVALLEGGPETLAAVVEAIFSPKRMVYIGRKNCVPSEPLFYGEVFEDNDILSALKNTPLFSYGEKPRTVSCRVELFPGEMLPPSHLGVERVKDVPLGRLDERKYGFRRVYTLRIPREEFVGEEPIGDIYSSSESR